MRATSETNVEGSIPIHTFVLSYVKEKLCARMLIK